MKAYLQQKTFLFKRPGGTSRGILTEKKSWFIILEKNGRKGIGESGPLKGLSLDDVPEFELKLEQICNEINNGTFKIEELIKWPSIRFAIECALKDLQTEENQILFPSAFTKGDAGIAINGLIWMGAPSFMKEQIRILLDKGFHCLKMKIGANNFEDEIQILQDLRSEFNPDDLVLRLDANGAFDSSGALEKLKHLSEFQLHSIEQPIQAGQTEKMAELCEKSPLPIALDEELIPILNKNSRNRLIENIQPQYIILKPSLVGGFQSSEEWIDIAKKNNCGWWVTSALESNVGLNAISQWTYSIHAQSYQGLGTGSLYTNNIPSPLQILGEKIYHNPNLKWSIDEL